MNNEISVLLEEYKIVNSRIESFLSNQSKFYFNGLVIIFGLLGIFQDYKEILLALPFVVISYTAIILYHYQRILLNQEYKKSLEAKLNSLYGEEVFEYTKLALDRMEKKNTLRHINMFGLILLILLSIIAFIHYFFVLENSIPTYLLIIISIFLIIHVVSIGVGFYIIQKMSFEI